MLYQTAFFMFLENSSRYSFGIIVVPPIGFHIKQLVLCISDISLFTQAELYSDYFGIMCHVPFIV